MKNINLFIISLILLLPLQLFSQTEQIVFQSQWVKPRTNQYGTYLMLSSEVIDKTGLPKIAYQFRDLSKFKIKSVKLDSIVPLPAFFAAKGPFIGTNHLNSDIQIQTDQLFINKKAAVSLSIIPLFEKNGQIYLAKKITISYTGKPSYLLQSATTFGQKAGNESVLATGSWHKIGIKKNDIYKVPYQFLIDNKIVFGTVPSNSLALYGNGSRMLPEFTEKPRPVDLIENPIQMFDGGDGTFGDGDYFLFYGHGANYIYYDTLTNIYRHETNLYSDTGYYFLTTSATNGKRIEEFQKYTGTTTYTSTLGQTNLLIEAEDYNFIETGRLWVGQTLSFSDYDTSFSLPNLAIGQTGKVKTQAWARCVLCLTKVQVNLNNQTLTTFNISGVGSSYLDNYASKATITATFTQNNPIKINISKIAGDEAWLDYVLLTFTTNHQYTIGKSIVKDKNAIGQPTTYKVANAANKSIWHVSDVTNAKFVNYLSQGNSAVFKTNANNLQKFIVFDQADATLPTYIERVQNQNLHGEISSGPAPALIIVTPKIFIPAANRLANYHFLADGMLVKIVTPQQIYNEFSGGSPDITAIRDYLKAYYDAYSPNEIPKYLCLLGDASYDYKYYKNRIETEGNFNLVPTYESENSVSRRGDSYGSDDYFGILDDAEIISKGNISASIYTLDIGIGRIPARTLEEAQAVVNKIINYSASSNCLGEWRNRITFIAGDMDASWERDFLNDSEAMSNVIKSNYPIWNINKIYSDAYVQETNAGQRYPDVNIDLNAAANTGTLLINYVGHGGEAGWAGERILLIEDIESWDNGNNLPAMSTITCTFTRYDDPNLLSAGEYVLLKEESGGIALFSTTRSITLYPNFGNTLANYAFKRNSAGEYPRLGDIIKYVKNINSGNPLNGKILLFGDPAMQLAYPHFNVLTDSISVSSPNSSDTIGAGQIVEVYGHVADLDSLPISSFNGILYANVYDKPIEKVTLQNDAQAVALAFKEQESIIFSGQATIKDGYWHFSFKVPMDISYQFGKGKISYYAHNGNTDAHGYYNKFTIGGIAEPCTENSPPEIEIYLNDTLFKEMGIANNQPVVVLKVSDESGINTSGIGLGHDIKVVIDNDPQQTYIVNEYYEADINTYKSGTVTYTLPVFKSGIHSIVATVWDGCNNVATDTLNFAVTNEDFAMINFYNYPNPFNDFTLFRAETNAEGQNIQATLNIFDISGRKVYTGQVERALNGYVFTIQWDGNGSTGLPVATGVYIARLRLQNEEGKTLTASTKLIKVETY